MEVLVHVARYCAFAVIAVLEDQAADWRGSVPEGFYEVDDVLRAAEALDLQQGISFSDGFVPHVGSQHVHTLRH